MIRTLSASLTLLTLIIWGTSTYVLPVFAIEGDIVPVHSLEELTELSLHHDNSDITNLIDQKLQYQTTEDEQDDILADGMSTRIIVDGERKQSKKIDGVKGNVSVSITNGTVISTPDGALIDASQIGLGSVSTPEKEKANAYHAKKKKLKNKEGKMEANLDFVQTFEFGIPGTHLLFSKPVRITIKTPNFSDGILVDLATMHAGENGFSTLGLSVDTSTQCRSDGSATKPSSQVPVRGGQVVFYTCGASSFTMNPVGGISNSNDLKLMIGDYGQVQVYYNGQAQIYGGDPPATGGNGSPWAWPRLRIGTTNIGNGATAWTTANTVGSQNGNTYTAKTTMTYVIGARTYRVVIDWNYTAPNKYFTWTYTITVPAGNTSNVRFYYGQDSMVAGSDVGDAGYYTTSPTQTIGIYDSTANVLSAQRYVSGQLWAGYIAAGYSTVQNQTNGGANYTNAVTTTAGDLGYGINWNFGTTPGTYTSTTEWRLLPYVSANVADLIPGIGQPDPTLAVGVSSQIPITLTNAGQASSSGSHAISFKIPTGVSGPSSSFSTNGWSCGAQVGTTVTCTKTTTITPLGIDTLSIPVIPSSNVQGTTLTFTVTNSGGGDSNATNNSASVQMQVAVAPAPADNTPPAISSVSITSGSLLPIGKFPLTITYSDAGVGVNTASFTGKIYAWNATNIAASYMSTLGNPTTTSGQFQINNLPFGKYRFDISVADTLGNATTQSYTYFIDAVEWDISTPVYDIGAQSASSIGFGSGEVIVTVKTVGAPFSITMQKSTDMSMSTEIVPIYDGMMGWGYDRNPYDMTLTAHAAEQILGTQSQSINQNGQKNTYTYRIKYGIHPSADQSAGDYEGTVKFGISFNY